MRCFWLTRSQRQIEIASPQICGADADLWLEFVKRDIPNWDTKPHTPKNPKSWYKVYKKLLAESMKEVDEDAVQLKAELDRIKQVQARNTIKTVELNVYKVPEGLKPQGPTLVMTRKPQFQDKIWKPPPDNRLKASEESDPDEPTHPSPGHPGHSTHPTRAARQNPSTTRAKPPQKSKLDKIRKEVKANSLFQHHNRNQLPEMKLKPMSTNNVIAKDKIVAKNKIISTNKRPIKAPRRMVSEHQRPAVLQPLDPSIKPPTVFNPKRARLEPERPTVAKMESRRLTSATKSTSIHQHTEHRTTSPLPHAEEPLPSIETPSRIATLLAAVHETTTSLTTQSLKTSDPPSTTTKAVSTPNNGAIHPPRRDSPYVRPSANTSSPSKSGVRPPMQIKRKPPVDVFMRPAKRQRAD